MRVTRSSTRWNNWPLTRLVGWPLGVNELVGVGHADGISCKKSTCQLSVFVLPSHKTETICCTGDGLMMVPSMRRLWFWRRFSPCDVAFWLNFTLASLRIHLTLTGMSCQVTAYCACTILRCTHSRSNSSFCCALKVSSGLAGLRITRTPLLFGGSAVASLSH